MNQPPNSESPPSEVELEHPRANPDILPRWELFAVLGVEMVIYTVFAIAGRLSHASGLSLVGVINTAMPFIIAWGIVGMMTRAFTGKAFYPPRRTLLTAAGTAMLAGPLGVVLRTIWLGEDLADIQVSFIIVATSVTTLMIVVWRFLWSRIRRAWWTELP